MIQMEVTSMNLSAQEKAQFYHALAQTIRSGLGLDRALRLLMEEGQSHRPRRMAERILAGIQEGKSLSESFADSAGGIDTMERAAIEAGEKSGALEQCFRYLARYFEAWRKTRRAIVRSLVYPALLLHLAVLLPIVPHWVASSDRAEAIQKALAILIGLYVIGFTLWVGFNFLRSLAPRSVFADSLIRRLPFFGKAREYMALERFCRIFSMLIVSGRKISSSIQAAGEVTKCAVFERATRHLAAEARNGQPVGPRMQRGRIFPQTFSQSIGNAETTGNLDEELERWADYFGAEALVELEKAAAWIPRILYFFVVIFVAWQIVSVYSGILNQALEQFDPGF